MRVICSWCRSEGQIGLVGEKTPLDDRRETHGICTAHRIEVQARWWERNGPSKTIIHEQMLATVVASQAQQANGSRRFVLSATLVWTRLKKLARRTGSRPDCSPT